MPSARLLLLLCLTALPALWQSGSLAADREGRVIVQSIAVTPEQVTIHLSAASVYTQAALPRDRLHGRAARCYVDVAGVLGQQVKRVYTGDAQRVQRVRVGQFRPRTVRIVLDLLTAQPCQVRPVVNPDRLQITVGAAPRRDNVAAVRLPEEPPPSVIRQESIPDRQLPPVAQQKPVSEFQTRGALEYLDLRTSETRPAQAISLFDQQTPDGTASQLSLFDQQTTGGVSSQSSFLGQQTPDGMPSQRSPFSRQALDEKTPQLVPRGLYLLQEQEAGALPLPGG